MRGTQQVTMEGGGMEGETQSPTSTLHLSALVSNFRKALFCKLELKRGHLLGLGRSPQELLAGGGKATSPALGGGGPRLS